MEFHNKFIPDKHTYFQKISETKMEPVNIADE